MIMKGTETYANLGLSEPVRLQRQVTTLTRAVAALSVLVALLFVGLVCMAVLLYGELQGAQRRGVELELPEVDQTGRTTQDARFIAYVKKVIQQLLRNNTYIERDEEKRGISYRWDRTTPLRGREDRYSWPSLWPTSPDQHWTIPSWGTQERQLKQCMPILEVPTESDQACPS
ncbi:uncharacterized protein LOC118425850 isoform X1 [Branchiostoma floridae]|uniref:Uncharacterized protein LOC118425850 isoform X1 n=1 Tax=Branchiostoma floridae TaxID=7739 RepID=A0A9J7N5N9_BRAFL|nr:uncharacterized protein LOC118425850 isoform X1 [Branchiostoma floridae]